MNKRYLKQWSWLAAGAICAVAAADQQPEFSTIEVTPHLYMISGVGGFTGGNIGLSVGDDGVVMIDDSMPPLLDKMKAAISTITPKPVNFLINTHVHGDHTGNNASMREAGTHIVAHQNLRSHLLNKGVWSETGMQKAPKESLPVITFADAIDFHLNGEDAHVFHVAHAHTDGDAVIYFKNANVIHAGDVMFNGVFPFIDFDSGGSLKGYIAAQKRILAMANDNTKIIPGHGPLASKKDLQIAIAMLEDAAALVAAQIKAGKSEDDIVKLNPLAKYGDKWSWEFISTEKMTRQIYEGLRLAKK